MNVKDDKSTQPAPALAALSEESSTKAKPRLEAAKSRVATFLTAFTPKKKTTPEKPPATQDAPVRPVIGSDKAAFFMDSKGRIVSVQPRCAGFFGRQPDELSGLNIKDVLKPGFDQEITNILAKGKEANEQSFHVLALRKDGSEFATQFTFKFLQDIVLRWAVFVQAPPGSSDQPAIVRTTETATTATPKPASDEKPPTQPVVRSRPRNPEQLAAQLEASQNERKRLERIKFEADKHLRQVQLDYGNRLIQLEQDLSAEREINERLSKRLEAQEQSVSAQMKGMRKIKEQQSEPAATTEKTQAELEDLKRRHQALESEAAGLRKERDELRSKQPSSEAAESQIKAQVAELTARLEQASSELRTLRAGGADNEAARKQLTADPNKERDANELSRKKAEELNAQLQKLQSATEQAEARLRESTARCSDWEKKAADLKKTTDELTRRHATEQNAAVKAAQRVQELEQQLKRAGNDQAAGKKDIEDHNATRQRLESENRKLTEANTKAKADLENWEKKAADLKKSIDELTGKHAAEQNAAVKAAQRVKELEDQLKRAGDDQAAGKKDIENQNATRQRLEAENRNLTEANTKAKADLDKEREATKASRRKEEELRTQVQKLQGAVEQAEARARESAAQSKDSEKKVAEIKKTVDELIRTQAAEKTVAAQSTQRIKELEQQLKRAGDDLAASKAEVEKQNSTCKRLDAENRELAEANAGTRADLDKEREANKLSRKRTEELNALLQKVQQAAEQTEKRAHESAAQAKDWEKQAVDHWKTVDELTRSQAAEQATAAKRFKELEQQLKRAGDDIAASKTEVQKAEARVRESATQAKDWEKKAADFKKNVDELTRSHASEKNAAGKAAERVKELEQQLKRAGDDLAATKAENRNLSEASAKARAGSAELAEKQAALEKKSGELEQRVRAHTFTLAKVNAELQNERVERERAGKSASSAAAQIEKLKEKLKRQVELEHASQSKIAELEKTIHDRGDDLARASAALRKEAKERLVAQKQSRLVSDMGTRLESNLASLEDAKKVFDASMQEKDERLQGIERSLADASSGLEKESAERRRLEKLLADAKKDLEKLSAESKVEISKLQAAHDLGELERKKLEGELLRTREGEEVAKQETAVTPDNGADSRKKSEAK